MDYNLLFFTFLHITFPILFQIHKIENHKIENHKIENHKIENRPSLGNKHAKSTWVGEVCNKMLGFLKKI